MTFARPLAALALVLVAAAGCTSDPAPAPPGTAPSSAAPNSPVDPYDAYQQLAPDGAPKLSREDAQTRALLGCGQAWAPGTVDAALADAYADLCKPR